MEMKENPETLFVTIASDEARRKLDDSLSICENNNIIPEDSEVFLPPATRNCCLELETVKVYLKEYPLTMHLLPRRTGEHPQFGSVEF